MQHPICGENRSEGRRGDCGIRSQARTLVSPLTSRHPILVLLGQEQNQPTPLIPTSTYSIEDNWGYRQHRQQTHLSTFGLDFDLVFIPRGCCARTLFLTKTPTPNTHSHISYYHTNTPRSPRDMVQTCPTETATVDQSSFWSSDGLNWDAHRIGWAISGGCAVLVSARLVSLCEPAPFVLERERWSEGRGLVWFRNWMMGRNGREI